jgi:hypothetical protein
MLARLSWSVEAALVLGWTVNLVGSLPDLDRSSTDEEMDAFFSAIPELGDELSEFLSQLSYRDPGQIYEENLLNELVTSYFRDLLFSGGEDGTNINRAVSFERHRALNWVRQFSGIRDWDDTDTST